MTTYSSSYFPARFKADLTDTRAKGPNSVLIPVSFGEYVSRVILLNTLYFIIKLFVLENGASDLTSTSVTVSPIIFYWQGRNGSEVTYPTYCPSFPYQSSRCILDVIRWLIKVIYYGFTDYQIVSSSSIKPCQ